MSETSQVVQIWIRCLREKRRRRLLPEKGIGKGEGVKVVAFVIPISRDLVQSPRRHETYFQGTYMRAALLARTFRHSSGGGGVRGEVREPCGTREMGISQTSTTATPIHDVVMYGSLFPPLSSHVSPFHPFLPSPLSFPLLPFFSLFLLLFPFCSLSLSFSPSHSLSISHE